MARATRARPLFSGTVLFSFNHAITSSRTSDRLALGRKHDFGPEKSSLILRSTAALRNPSHRAISAWVFAVHHLKISHLLLACAIPTQSRVSSSTAKIVRIVLNTIASTENAHKDNDRDYGSFKMLHFYYTYLVFKGHLWSQLICKDVDLFDLSLVTWMSMCTKHEKAVRSQHANSPLWPCIKTAMLYSRPDIREQSYPLTIKTECLHLRRSPYTDIRLEALNCALSQK